MSIATQTSKVDHSAHPWVGTAGHTSISLDRGTFDSALLRHRLRRHGEATLLMMGKSMSPLLPEGSRVTLRALKPDEELRGAIVAVDCGPKVIVHRVVRAEGDSILTQGLNARDPDAPSTRGSVIGVVCERSGWPVKEMHLRRAASAWTLSIRSLRALRKRW